MRSRTPLSRVARLVLLGSLLAASACKSGQEQPPSPPASDSGRAEISNEFTSTAEVVAVAPEARMLTLRREDGTQIDVRVAESVRNFDQIAVGDALRVRYRETLAAERRPAGEIARPAEGAVAAARARPGDKPGAGLGVAISLPVRIESLDLEREIVVFSPASGELIARRVQTPEGREFIRGLKVGDTVQLEYTQMLALAVEEL
jgi:hypothetical protein